MKRLEDSLKYDFMIQNGECIHQGNSIIVPKLLRNRNPDTKTKTPLLDLESLKNVNHSIRSSYQTNLDKFIKYKLIGINNLINYPQQEVLVPIDNPWLWEKCLKAVGFSTKKLEKTINGRKILYRNLFCLDNLFEEIKLNIEVDSQYHVGNEKEDEARDLYLRSMYGITTIRAFNFGYGKNNEENLLSYLEKICDLHSNTPDPKTFNEVSFYSTIVDTFNIKYGDNENTIVQLWKIFDSIGVDIDYLYPITMFDWYKIVPQRFHTLLDTEKRDYLDFCRNILTYYFGKDIKIFPNLKHISIKDIIYYNERLSSRIKDKIPNWAEVLVCHDIPLDRSRIDNRVPLTRDILLDLSDIRTAINIPCIRRL